ncbi:MAG: ferritin family protein [Deltaproteobacteria bacterium]|nr:ferritin family protein [Candidatus Zymogenaceae bacterium]
MSNTPESSLEMLDKALEMEKKGKDFYEKAAVNCQNELGREVFQTLKRDEDVHIARIMDIYNNLTKGGQWSSEWKAKDFSHGDLTAFFSDLAHKHRNQTTADASDIQALEIGIDFELGSVTFYEQRLAAAEDTLEREFIGRMVVEEKSHHNILQDAKLYLTDPSSWFQEHERGGLDGA